MARKSYVTKSLVEAAWKARAISKAERDYIINGGRKVKDTQLYSLICKTIREWREAGAAPVRRSAAASPVSRQADDSADRVAALKSRRNEIGEIPPVRRRRLRESCRLDLARFGWIYCRMLLDHRPSEAICDRYILKLQNAILHGGQLAVEFARGAGKTSWVVIALVWAILYGHRRFPVCIAASRSLAKTIRKMVYSLFVDSEPIYQDFPAVPTALRKMNGAVQKGMVLTYNGRNTGFESGELALVLPDMRDADGARIDRACGAVIASRGVGGSVRGLNIRGMRPDFVLFDDPQTQKDAHSASAVKRIDEFIHSDALSLAANTSTMAAFLTITPQCADDLAMRIVDASVHPNWSVSSSPFLIKTPADFDRLALEFCDAYALDTAAGDFMRSGSRRWYEAHRAEFAGVECLDPLAYDKACEVDAVHHALNKIAAIGRSAFDAEYQMQPVRETFAFEISDKLILSRIRKGVPPNTPLSGGVLLAAATDINPAYALSTSVISFDLDLTALVVAYHATPIKISDRIPEAEFDRRVFEALAAHGREIAALGLKINRWGIDAGGRQFQAVTRFVQSAQALCGLPATAMLGRAGRNWNPFVRSRIRAALNDTVYCRDMQGREWLAFDADVYKERAQLAWTAEPGAPGGLSLFDGGADHRRYAIQIANEKLVEKKRIRRADGMDGSEYKWKTRDPHDFGDTLAMGYALAGSEGISGDGSRHNENNAFDGWEF